mmetsp:Transcript_60600/g.107585  ORF Transcript_60600/g.107585 Transcript_60600/m.107585 type:complete len:1815 (-) Transcript_60600:188-5632(-)
MAITNRISRKMPQAEVEEMQQVGGEKSNVEVLVEYVLERCTDKREAALCFKTFLLKNGKDNPIGRTFTEDDVKVAMTKYDQLVPMYTSTDDATSVTANDFNAIRGEVQTAVSTKPRVTKAVGTSPNKAAKEAGTAHTEVQAAAVTKPAVAKEAAARTEVQAAAVTKPRVAKEAGAAHTEVQTAVAARIQAIAKAAAAKAVAALNSKPGTVTQLTRLVAKQAPPSEQSYSVPMDNDGKKRKMAVPSPRKKGQKVEASKRQKKGEKNQAKSKQSSLCADEALFGSESEDGLSAEEEVDHENEDADAALLDDLALQKGADIDDLYPAKAWEKVDPKVLPGCQGFNERATKVMHQLGVALTPLQSTFDKEATCPPLQPHQESVAFLLHPRSPITRLLIDHPTGSGKTREMIRTLDNYFFDPRPKIPIFPKDHVCRNFYAELLRWPNRYRNYFCCERPEDALIVSGVPDWRERRFHMWDLSNFAEPEVRRLCYCIRDVLEMKGMFYRGMVRRSCKLAFNKKAPPGEYMPRAPLRALGYTSAGGAFSNIVSGRPQSSLMKIGYVQGSDNVYTNKVVLMDEVHNLLMTQTQYGAQLAHLRELLYGANNLVLAGFTGTPILNNPKEGQTLLQIIKGFKAPKGNEGFLSSFPMRPQPLFPVSLPLGIPDGVLTEQLKTQLIKEVEIHGETLKIYEWKRRSGYEGRRLRAYCNCSTYHGSFHEGRSGTKIRVLSFPEDCCPKLLAIALEVASKPEKAVIMTSRMSGYIVMLELMKFIAMRHETPFWVATMDELAEFNHVSNIRGEVYRVLVADAAQCSEGISFLAVRRTFISDVPASPSHFLQQCGRAIRMYGHRGLPQEEQTVITQLYVAKFPKWIDTTLAGWSLRAQSTSNANQVRSEGGKEFEKKAQSLLSRLNAAGFMTLTDLKTRVDEFGKALSAHMGSKADYVDSLTAQDIVAFLENNGLADEAKWLKAADGKDWEKAFALRQMKEVILQNIEVSQPGLAPGSLTPVRVGQSLSSSQDSRTHAADATAADVTASVSCKEPAPISTSVDKPFNGEWQSGQNLVQIKDNNLFMEGNPWTEITIKSFRAFELVDPENGVVTAQLSADRMKIKWSDGDEWTRVQVKPQAAIVLERAVELLRSVDQELTSGSKGSRKTKNSAKSRAAGDPVFGDTLPGGSDEIPDDIPMPCDDASTGPPADEKSQWRLMLNAGLAELLEIELIAALMPTLAPGFSRERMHRVTPDQVRAWLEEFARLQNFALCMQALAAVRLALQEMKIESAGESWRKTLAALLQHLQSIEDVDTAMEDARIPADIAEATPAQVEALRSELEKLKVQGDVPQTKSRALVLAMQDLYVAPTIKEASQTLTPETADQEALRHLMLQTHDFAPALSDLRSLAVDRNVLSHLTDQSGTQDAQDSAISSKKAEGKRSKSTVSEVVPGQVVKLHSLWSKPELNGQLTCTNKLIPETGQWECRILSSVQKETVNVDPTCFTFIQGSAKTTREIKGFTKSPVTNPSQPAPGKKVRLHSLMSKPELNDQIAIVGFVKESERWECRLLLDPSSETSAPLMVKEANMTVVHDVVDILLMPSDKAPGVGDKVMLHSLVAKKELNGQLAMIESLNAETLRWECSLCSEPQSDRFNLKISSLTVVSNGNQSMAGRKLWPGRSVRLHSLKARPELNGQLARVERFIPESCRWECQLLHDAQGEKVNLNAGNLATILSAEELSALELSAVASDTTMEVPEMSSSSSAVCASDNKSSSSTKDSGKDSERQKAGPEGSEGGSSQRKRKADGQGPKSVDQKIGLDRVQKLLKGWKAKNGGKK